MTRDLTELDSITHIAKLITDVVCSGRNIRQLVVGSVQVETSTRVRQTLWRVVKWSEPKHLSNLSHELLTGYSNYYQRLACALCSKKIHKNVCLIIKSVHCLLPQRSFEKKAVASFKLNKWKQIEWWSHSEFRGFKIFWARSTPF